MIALAEARRTVLEAMVPLPVEVRALAEAIGCVLGEPVVAPEPVPSFTNSAMDGYALRAQDTTSAPCPLQVVGTVMAGDAPTLTLRPGQAARIMTGAPLPAGADAVCMVERTHPGDAGSVVVEGPVSVGEHVRHPGEDVAAGSTVFEAGVAVTPAHLGVLTSLGIDEVAVVRRPRVGVLSTGDELVTGTGPLAPGKIRDSNRPGLLARLAADGAVAVDLGRIGDDESLVAAAFAEAAGTCDAIVTSGGVSVGDRDVVRMVLDRLGGPHMVWMQVAIKPAKPFAFGRIGESATPVFGLPGNPVSALVSYELFVRPALRAMAGHHRLDRPVLRAAAAEPLTRQPDGKLHLVRVVATVGADGTLQVTPSTGQASHQLRALADANALALVPDGVGVAAGEPVAVLLLDESRLGTAAHSRFGLGPGFTLEPAW